MKAGSKTKKSRMSNAEQTSKAEHVKQNEQGRQRR